MQTKILENCKHTHTHTNTHTHWTHAGHTHRNIHIIVQRFVVYCLYHVLPKNHNEENETKKMNYDVIPTGLTGRSSHTEC